jgi:hypothetical protein
LAGFTAFAAFAKFAARVAGSFAGAFPAAGALASGLLLLAFSFATPAPSLAFRSRPAVASRGTDVLFHLGERARACY